MSFVDKIGGFLGKAVGALGVPFLGSTAMSMAGGLYEGKHARDESQRQMDFQRDLSNTAHQRETEDLLKAGLNPMLTMSHPGASTPQGAMAQMRDPVSPAISSGVNAMIGRATVANLMSQADLHSAQAEKERATTPQELGGGETYGWLMSMMAKYDYILKVNQADYTAQQQTKVLEETTDILLRRDKIPFEIKIEELEARLRELHIPEAEALANFWRSEFGKASPYLKPLGSVAAGAASAVGAASVLGAGKRAVERVRGYKSVRPSRDGRGDYVHMPTGELYK